MKVELFPNSNYIVGRKVAVTKKTSLFVPTKNPLSGLPIIIVVHGSKEMNISKGQLLVCSKDILISNLDIENKKHYMIKDFQVICKVLLDSNDTIIYEEDFQNLEQPKSPKGFF